MDPVAQRASEQLNVVVVGGNLCVIDDVSASGGWPPPAPSRLEFLAEMADVDAEVVRHYLRQEIDARSRATAERHASAHRRLDQRVARASD